LCWNGSAKCSCPTQKKKKETEKEEKPFPEPSSGFGGLILRRTCNKPIIAAVNGYAFGGGFELALACDIIVASQNAVFSLPEPKVGLAALAGGLVRLPKVIGKHNALGIILTGKRVSAEEGYRLGFVNDVVPHNELLNKAKQYAEQILACSPDSIEASKKCVLASLDAGNVIDEIIQSQQYPVIREMIKGENTKEGVAAFNEKRKPNWTNKSKL